MSWAAAKSKEPLSLESGAVAPMSLQSIWRCKLFALPPQPMGGVEAYAELTGEEWKVYETRSEDRFEKNAAEAQLADFGC